MSATCSVVFYHYVRDAARTSFPGLNALSTVDFEAQLDWLQARYAILDYGQFETALADGRGFDEPSALLTFDDGFVDHYESALPALKKRSLSGVFFIAGATLGPSPALLNVHKTHFLLSVLGAESFAAEVAGELDRLAHQGESGGDGWSGIYRYDGPADLATKRLLNYELPFPLADRVLHELFCRRIADPAEFARGLYLSADMIAEMSAAGMAFGYHTRSHRVLSRLDYEGQQAELAGGVETICGLTGQRSVPFCYPYGHAQTYNSDTLSILADAGYSMAFNTLRRAVRGGTDARYELPRFDTRDLPIAESVASHA